jgi:hypothetical protein
MSRFCMLCLVLWAMGCGGGDKSDSAAGVDGGTTVDTSGGDGDGGSGSGTGDDPDAPQAVVVDALCSVHTTGETFASWAVLGTATDPQGADTLLGLVPDGAVVLQGGAEVYRTALSCTAPDLSEAQCSASFGQWDGAADCSGATSVQIVIEVEDEDGNRAASEPVQGRAE